jgi:hypothetical protein
VTGKGEREKGRKGEREMGRKGDGEKRRSDSVKLRVNPWF